MMKKRKKTKGVILALANQKGGVGKSVSSTNLSCAFAREGYKVLLVDADYQGNASAQIGVKKQAQDLDKTISSGLLKNQPAETVWLKTKFENVYSIASDQDFSEFNILFLGHPGAHGKMREWLESARDEFDFIIVDTHPSLDLTFQNVMVAADYYLLPLFAEPESLEGLHVMFKHVKDIKELLNPPLHILGCFVTRFDKSIKTHKVFMNYIENFGKKIGMPLIGCIPSSKAVPASSVAKTPLVVSQPKLPVAAGYIKLAENLVPMLRVRRGRSPKTPQLEKKEVQQIMDDIENRSQSNVNVETHIAAKKFTPPPLVLEDDL